MKIYSSHPWVKTVAEAKEIQERLRHKVIATDCLGEVKYVAGVVSRSRTKVKPIYVSIRHRISLPRAIDYAMGCLTKYRLPETTRWADKLASHQK